MPGYSPHSALTIPGRAARFQSARIRATPSPQPVRAGTDHAGFSFCAFTRDAVFKRTHKKIDHAKIDIVDAAKEDDYVVSMRRRVRPLCFRAPPGAETVASLNASFSIPPKMEHSTYRLTCTDRSKRQSSHSFAKRESRQTKLRLEVSSSDAARPRHSRLAASGSESSLLSYLVSSMDWTESRRVSKSKRPSVGNGNIISIILSRTRGGRPSLFICGEATNFRTRFTFSR